MPADRPVVRYPAVPAPPRTVLLDPFAFTDSMPLAALFPAAGQSAPVADVTARRLVERKLAHGLRPAFFDSAGVFGSCQCVA
jgi:hypothetical protein